VPGTEVILVADARVVLVNSGLVEMDFIRSLFSMVSLGDLVNKAFLADRSWRL